MEGYVLDTLFERYRVNRRKAKQGGEIVRERKG